MGWISEAITGLGNSAYNIFTGERARNDSLAVQNFQRDMAMKQYALQREQFDFQKKQAEYQKYYDSNAVSIRAQDMERAGLSKTLAAGASGNSGMQMVSATGNPESGLSVPSDVKKSPFDKLTSLIDFETRAKQLELLNSQVDSQSADSEIKRYNLLFAKRNNLPYGSSPDSIERLATLISNSLSGNRGFSDSTKSLGTAVDTIKTKVEPITEVAGFKGTVREYAQSREKKVQEKIKSGKPLSLWDKLWALPDKARNSTPVRWIKSKLQRR